MLESFFSNTTLLVPALIAFQLTLPHCTDEKLRSCVNSLFFQNHGVGGKYCFLLFPYPFLHFLLLF